MVLQCCTVNNSVQCNHSGGADIYYTPAPDRGALVNKCTFMVFQHCTVNNSLQCIQSGGTAMDYTPAPGGGALENKWNCYGQYS